MIIYNYNSTHPFSAQCLQSYFSVPQGQVFRLGEESFANALIGQINKFVTHTSVTDNVSFDIFFEDGSELSISLRPEDYVGPEAVNFYRRDHIILVV